MFDAEKLLGQMLGGALDWRLSRFGEFPAALAAPAVVVAGVGLSMRMVLLSRQRAQARVVGERAPVAILGGGVGAMAG